MKPNSDNIPKASYQAIRVFLAFIITLALAYFFVQDIELISGLLGVGLLCVYLFLPIKGKFYSLLVLTICIPESGRSAMFFSVNVVGFNYIHILEVMYGIIIVGFVLELLLGKEKLRLLAEHWVLLLFFLIVIISIIKGTGVSLKNSFHAGREYFYYLLIIVAFTKIRNEQDFRHIVYSIFIGVFLYNVILLSIYIMPGHPWRGLIAQQGVWSVTRIAFRNHSLFIFSIPLSLVFFFSQVEYPKKILSGFVFISSLLFVFMSQGRNLMVCVMLSVLFLLIIMFMKRKVLKVNFAAMAFTALLSVIVIVFIFSTFNIAEDNVYLSDSIRRIQSLFRLSHDDSFNYRVDQMAREEERMRGYLLFGQGMKGFYRDFNMGKFKNVFWDNTNTLMIRKVGLFGYIIFLIFVLMVLLKAVIAINLTNSRESVSFLIAVLSIIPASVFRLFTSPYLVQYKIIFFYAAILGVVQSMYQIIRKERLTYE